MQGSLFNFPMESQMEATLFQYTSRQVTNDDMKVWLTNCTLRVDIGHFKNGDRMDLVIVDYAEGEVTLVTHFCTEHTFPLRVDIAA